MALTKLTAALDKISSLATLITGQATTVKAAFDHDVNVVKDYINEILIPEVEDKLETKEDLATNRKLSPTGDFTGTWGGKTMVETDPGIQVVVNEHTSQLADIENQVNGYLVNVKYPPLPLVGAKGDGITDDTSIINALVSAVKNNKWGGLYFPDSTGAYMINGVDMTDVDTSTRNKYGGILIDAPMKIILHPNAVLKAITTDQNGYTILNVHDTHDVYVEGGTILGERTTHIGTTGEQGHGIKIMTSHDIHLKNIHIRDCWGDGIITCYNNAPYAQNYNFTIDGVISKNNRRCGLAIIDGKNIYITRSEFSETNGTSPACGIDIEADGIALGVTDVIIDNCIFNDNVEQGLVFGGGNGCDNIKILNNTFRRNGIGMNLIGTDTSPVFNAIIVNNTINIDGSATGMSLKYVYKCLISKNNIFGNQGAITAKGISIDINASLLLIDTNELNWLDVAIYYIDSTTNPDVKIHNNSIANVVKPIQGGGLRCEFVANMCDIFSGDCSVYMQYGKFCDNKFSNSTIGAIYGLFDNCLVKGNAFSDISNANKSNSMMLLGKAENCFIEGNYFNSASAQPAITELNVPIVPSVIANNHAKSEILSASFVLQSGTILGTNYTA